MVVHVWSGEGIRDHPSRTAVIIHRYLFGDLHEKAGQRWINAGRGFCAPRGGGVPGSLDP